MLSCQNLCGYWNPIVTFYTKETTHTVIHMSKRHPISLLSQSTSSINKKIKKIWIVCYMIAAIHHLLWKSCSSTSIIFFLCHLALSTMKMVTATKTKINIRIPPMVEEMTVVVIGTLSRAGIDGETMTWGEEGFALDGTRFAADVARHEEPHKILEVDTKLAISTS